jgi:hypothetical protein
MRHVEGVTVFKRSYILYAVLVLSLVPMTVLASEREAFNPPGIVGWIMVALALGLPLVARAIFFRDR